MSQPAVERRCIRCGTPTVYASGLCGYCQRPEKQSTKNSETPRGVCPRCGHNGTGVPCWQCGYDPRRA